MNTRSIRNHNGAMQTATHTYAHPDGRRFKLIGVVHIAAPAFWDYLRRRIATDEAGGYEVHYEMIQREQGAPRPPLEGRPFMVVADLLNLETQWTGMPIQPHWHNTDMTEPELIEAAAPDQDAMRALLAKSDKPLTLPDNIPDAAIRFLLWILRTPWALATVAALGGNKALRKIISDGRTDYAMARMLPLATDVVTIWGAGHLPRMGKLLGRAGYRLTETDWRTVIPAAVAQGAR